MKNFRSLGRFASARILRGLFIAALSLTAPLALALAGNAQTLEGMSASENAALRELIDAAKKEGQLTVYSVESGSMVEADAADFQERFGIKMESTRLVSGDLTARYAAEVQSGRVVADAIILAATPFFTDHPDWWEKIDDNFTPGIASYPKGAIGEDYITLSQQSIIIAYNTDLIKPEDAPKSYEDLLDERFSAPGTIVITDPRATQSGMSFFSWMIEKLGPDYYEKLMKQQPAIGPGAAPVAQLIGAGANAVGIGTFTNHIQAVKSAGAPVAYVYPPEVATGTLNQLAISSQAPHPNAARLYAAYRMSKNSHKILCKVGGSSTPLGAIDGCEPPTSDSYLDVNYGVWSDRDWQVKNLPLLGLAPN